MVGWEEKRLSPRSATWGWEQAEGAFAGFSLLVAGLYTGGRNLCLTEPWAGWQSLLLLRVIRSPQRSGHQVAGGLVLLPVLDLACPAEGKAVAWGLC